MTRVLLLPSPLLPRLVYLAFLHALGARLRDAERVECWVDVAVFPRPAANAHDVLAAFGRSVQRTAPDLVLAHSNAGRYASSAAPGIPVVHIDAALPPASGHETPMAPNAMLEHLAAMADDDGLLPPWSRWWPQEDFARVLPDAAARESLREHEHRMPLSYFRSRFGAPAGWAEQHQAYLAFGDTYAEESAFARHHGWPTMVLAGTLHLHHLVDPDAVAAAVLDLAARLKAPPVSGPPAPPSGTRG